MTSTDDVQAIKNILYSYAEYLDTGDLDALGELFEHAAIRIAGSEHELRGAAAARNLIEQSVQLYEGIPRTKHVITNVIVELDDSGNSAAARSYYTALQAHPNLPLQPILAGRWHDRLERIGGRWRLVDRLIHTDLIGDISCHLKGVQE